VTKVPTLTDNAAAVYTTLTQPTTDRLGHQQALIDAVKRAKMQGAHFYGAHCRGREIDIGGWFPIRSSYPGIATWPASIVIAENPISTYKPPKVILGPGLQIYVSITVGGGDANPIEHPPTTPPHTNCSKEIATLLE
jgi:hypothetical protein